MKWILCLGIAVVFSVAFAEVGVTIKDHSCKEDWWGDKDYFYLNCSEGETIVVKDAVLYPFEQNLTCVMNNSKNECRHNFTQKALDYCSNMEICRLRLDNYAISIKKSCCKNLHCHDLEYECVPASCKTPQAPANGQ
ncbi:unnamed protein product, partial [Owenia fusiformis]